MPRPLTFAVPAFWLVAVVMIATMYRIGYLPPVRTGMSEIVDFYVQGWNIVNTPSARFAYLPELGVHEPGSAHGPIVYTHGPNSHRFISALIIAAGVVNIQQVLVLGCMAGVTFISAGALVFLKRASSPWWMGLFLLLLLIDYTAADQIINPYRVWHYGLFVLALAASVRPLRSRAGLMLAALSAFLLFQYEIAFAVFAFVVSAFVAATAAAHRRDRLAFLGTFAGGAALSLGVFFAQLLLYYGSVAAVVEEARKTYVERNTVLYPGQTWFVVPTTYLEYVKRAFAYLSSHNGTPLILLVALGLALAVAMVATGRWHKLSPDLLRSEAVRIAIGCLLGVLAAGFVSRGFVAYMYLSLGLPMINLLAYSTMLALLDVIYRLADLLSGNGRVSLLLASVAAAAAGCVVVNTNDGWPTYGDMHSANYGDTEFYLLERHATRGVPVASNMAWPLTGVVHGITGRVPIHVPDAAGIPQDGSRQFDLYLCHSSTDRCNLEQYTGAYTVLGQDHRFMLVKLE